MVDSTLNLHLDPLYIFPRCSVAYFLYITSEYIPFLLLCMNSFNNIPPALHSKVGIFITYHSQSLAKDKFVYLSILIGSCIIFTRYSTLCICICKHLNKATFQRFVLLFELVYVYFLVASSLPTPLSSLLGRA